jgi:thioredoxin reductase (NADPH)
MQTIHTDIALIGAGPIGLELAVALKAAGFDYVHLDARQIGGTIQWWPPGTRWFSSPERISIAGVPLVTPTQEKATREEYLAYLRGIVLQFGLKILTYRRVVHIARQPDADHPFTLETRRTARAGGLDLATAPPGEVICARRLILATGGTEQPRMLDIPGENLPHVTHYFQDPHTYFQQKLLIVGGRNSAIEAALRCHRAGARVALSYRHPALDVKDIKYWLYPEVQSLIKSGAITGYFDTSPTAITSTQVTLRHKDGRSEDVPADFVLLLTGYTADMRLCQMAGVELSGPRDCPTYDPDTLETNVPGVYIAGTATGGTQSKYRVFLENCHVHVRQILAALEGRRISAQACAFDSPES